MAKDFPVRSLSDQVQKYVRALEALKEPVDKWDTLLVAITEEKLNSVIREKWEDFSCESTNPTFKELLTFLQRRAQFKDTKSYQAAGNSEHSSGKKSSQPRSQQAYSASTTKIHCPHGQGEHLIYKCELLKKLSPSERFEGT